MNGCIEYCTRKRAFRDATAPGRPCSQDAFIRCITRWASGGRTPIAGARPLPPVEDHAAGRRWRTLRVWHRHGFDGGVAWSRLRGPGWRHHAHRGSEGVCETGASDDCAMRPAVGESRELVRMRADGGISCERTRTVIGAPDQAWAIEIVTRFEAGTSLLEVPPSTRADA